MSSLLIGLAVFALCWRGACKMDANWREANQQMRAAQEESWRLQQEEFDRVRRLSGWL